jgi:hypothetical protein
MTAICRLKPSSETYAWQVEHQRRSDQWTVRGCEWVYLGGLTLHSDELTADALLALVA